MIKSLIKKIFRKKEIRTGAKIFFLLRAYFAKIINIFIKIKYLNIGGGPVFSHIHWKNLDAAKSFLNTHSSIFHNKYKIPLSDNSIDLVYSSHCFEHLEEDVVETLINESHRVLKKNGKMIIKIPDYDSILINYRNKNFTYFENLEDFGTLQEDISAWKDHGINPNLENFISFLFFSYYSKEVTSIFENDGRDDIFYEYRKNRLNKNISFFGPVKIDDKELDYLLNNLSPLYLTRKIKEIAFLNTNKDKIVLNHQSAWGKEEFSKIINKQKFEILNSEKNNIIYKYRYIPKINEMTSSSLYLELNKQ